MKRLLLAVLVVLCANLATAANHPDHPSFSAPDAVSLAGDELTVTDDAVFRGGWYAAEGDANWTEFLLDGEHYPRSSLWVQGRANHTVPALGRNVHYFLVYSCTNSSGTWDCHGNDDHPDGYWQLHTINTTGQYTPAVFGDGPNELPSEVYAPPAIGTVTLPIPVPHQTFTGFASTESRVYSGDGLLASIVDLMTYKQAYYSHDGSTWQQSIMQGTEYADNPDWIRGDAIFFYPEFFSEPGDYYVAIFTCDKEYIWLEEPFDCHGSWQLIAVTDGETDAADPYARVHGFADDFSCGNQLDYQCGQRTICGDVIDFGSCQDGYDCNDNLCIARSDISCDGITCAADEYCSRGVCLLDVTGTTYFVSLKGDDNNPGTFDQPFYSWQRGAEMLHPGDIVYIRGGVWYPTEYLYNSATIGLLLGPGGYANLRSGTAENPIRVHNYPGEKPIVDGSLATTSPSRWLSGIGIGGEHIHLRGLTLRHIHQTPPDFRHVKPYSEVGGIGSNGASHRFENVVVHDIDGRAFQHWSYAWREEDAQHSYDHCVATEDPAFCVYRAPEFFNDTTSWINCDAFNLFSRYEAEPGNAADGWKVGTYHGSTFIWKGCRAWNYSDDGFDPHGSGTRIFDNCWASSMNNFADITPMYGTEGNGFKTTGPEGVILPADEHNVIYKGCIAADNYGHGSGSGFIANLVTPDEYPSNPLVINTLSYKNGYAYWDLHGGEVRNNIAHATRNIGPIGETYTIAGTNDYEASNNTWYPSPSSGWPPSHINPAYEVADDDFVSLDVRQLTRPRKADGSLPDIDFGHLAEGSDLIDGGIVVPGYHCDTSGPHPDDDCIEWYGAAPDLGPFESDYETACIPDTSCASSTCVGDTCVDSCGDTVQGTMDCTTTSGALIADHEAADDFDTIPVCWVEEAKQRFAIGYGHTSHGSQITSGMSGLNDLLNAEGNHPQNLFSFHPYGYNGALALQEGGSYEDGTWLAYDVGYGGWDTRTREYLDHPDHHDRNVIIWSWCGQVNDVDLQTHYFDNMMDLRGEYPSVDFIYMTGHLEANQAVLEANNHIRAHVAETDGILFDFADIEKWDPAGTEHPLETDACGWCTTWCSAHAAECDPILAEVPYCAHSHDYNCYRKAKAFWWMVARMAGWNGLPDGGGANACP